MALGTAAAVNASLDVCALDRDSNALALFAATAARLRDRGLADLHVTTKQVDLAAAQWREGADLVLIGSTLNELPAKVAETLVKRAWASMCESGAVVIIEPGTRQQSRRLLELRDTMIDAGANVFAPCSRKITPCPALANPSDWCHEERATQLPPNARRLATRTHLRAGGMVFSYLVLTREDAAQVFAADGELVWRVVSRLRKLKGVRECFACSDLGRVRLRLLKRHRSIQNAAFERVERGDLLCFAGDGPTLAPDQHVARVALSSSTGEDEAG